VFEWALKPKAVTYFIGKAAHHLIFIGILETPFKHHLMAFNKHSFSLKTIIKAFAFGYKFGNENSWELEFDRGWTQRSEVSTSSCTRRLDVNG
jgi:hypothetical protein